VFALNNLFAVSILYYTLKVISLCFDQPNHQKSSKEDVMDEKKSIKQSDGDSRMKHNMVYSSTKKKEMMMKNIHQEEEELENEKLDDIVIPFQLSTNLQIGAVLVGFHF